MLEEWHSMAVSTRFANAAISECGNIGVEYDPGRLDVPHPLVSSYR